MTDSHSSNNTHPPGPLAGIRILDLTWVLAGPYAAMILCDLGAEVVKVERPPHGDVARTTGPFVNNESMYFQSVNRGKKSISIDLRSSEGHDLFLQLVDEADVVMENFTPGVMDKLGIGPLALLERNPRLVFASTSGFGQTGPMRDKPALDIIVQGMGGVMSITGYPDEPPARPGTSIGDICGGFYTAIGILAALRERDHSGRGQSVDISMLDCQIAILENAVARYFATGQEPGPLGTRHPSATPFQAFPTADGWMVVALSWGIATQWEIFCAELGLPELVGDERFDTSFKRTENHAQLEPVLFAATRKQSTEHWVSTLAQYGIPIGPLNTIGQAVQQEQIAAREMITTVHHPVAGDVTMAASPLKLSRTPGRVYGAAPQFGEDTADVLESWLGVTPEQTEQLVQSGVVLTEGGPDIAAYLSA